MKLSKALLPLIALLSFSSQTLAEYPEKNIELIVPWAQGGGTDTIARALAIHGKKYLGVDVNVINKTGAQGIIGMSKSKVARADGYTVGFITFGLSTFKLMGISDLTFRDYHLLQMLNQSPAALSVRSDSEWDSLRAVVDHARENRGRVKVGHTGAGAANHLSAASLSEKHGIDFTFVPVGGGAPTKQALLDGRIDVAATGIDEVKDQYDAGRIKILAVNSASRHPTFPNVPTFAEAGYAVDAPILDWRGLVIPQGVDPDRAKFLEEGFKKMFDDPEFRAYCESVGLTLVYKDADDYADFLLEMENVLVPTVESVGLKAE